MDRNTALNRLDLCLSRMRRVQTSRRAAGEYAARSGVRLSPLSLSIVAELHRHGPARVKPLAERLGSELTRTSREISALDASGHVRRRPDETDGRAVVVELTRDGARAWTAYRAAARGALDELLADWDDESLDTFSELFDRFVSAAILGLPNAGTVGPRTVREAPDKPS